MIVYGKYPGILRDRIQTQCMGFNKKTVINFTLFLYQFSPNDIFIIGQLEDFLMVRKPTYEELEQRVKELEEEAITKTTLRAFWPLISAGIFLVLLVY